MARGDACSASRRIAEHRDHHVRPRRPLRALGATPSAHPPAAARDGGLHRVRAAPGASRSEPIIEAILAPSAANPKFAHIRAARMVANFGFKSGTRIIELLASFDSEVRK